MPLDNPWCPEASDVAWRADAVAKLREDFGPEEAGIICRLEVSMRLARPAIAEVIDDFDWHVIMRFKHAAACEEVG